MYRLSSILIVSFLSLGLATSAMAAGPYFSAMGGAAILQDADNTLDTGEVLTSEFDTGSFLGVAGGFAFPMGLRVEGELGYRQNDFHQGSFNGFTAPLGGDVTAFSVMANVAYDFNLTFGLKPYVLAGLGFAQVSMDVSVSGIKLADDDDTVFAWQIGGGVAYAVAPKVDLFLDYRYFATADPSFTAVDGTPFDSEYASHNFSVGVRVTF